MAMEWTQLANSLLPDALAIDLGGGAESAPRVSLIEAWNSAVFDSKRRRVMLVRTGGHADGAHNGVRAYDHGTLVWSLLKADSLNFIPLNHTLPTSTWKSIYPDGTPASVHTYNGVCYMPEPYDRVWSAGGVYWHPGGDSVPPSTFLYDITNSQWEKVTDRPGGFGCISVWDPVTERVLFRTSGGFFAYTPPPPGSLQGGTYTTLFTGTASTATSSNLVIDANARKVYYVPKHGAAPFHYRMIDLNNLALKDQMITVTGDTEIAQIQAPGLIWDQTRLVALGWNDLATNATLYSLDPTTNVWVQQTTTGTCPLPPKGTQGTWTRFYRDPVTGDYNYVHPNAIYTITPDVVTAPPLNPIEIVADLQIDFQYDAAPPTPPDPPGGAGPLAVNTWTMVPNPPAGSPLSVRRAKHVRVVYDSLRERHMVFGGDWVPDPSNGNPAVWAYDTPTGTTTLLSPQCVPAPGLTPNYPDNGPTVYDSTRDRVVTLKGFWNTQRRDITPTTTLAASSTELTAGITITAGASAFESWHTVTSTELDAGLPGRGLSVHQTSTGTGNPIIANGIITSVLSPTQAILNMSTGIAFPSTGSIASGRWRIAKGKKGIMAEAPCSRNFLAGDTGVLDDAAVYNCALNVWERGQWPTSPLGVGTDAGGPAWAVYHEPTDAAYMVKQGQMMILHLDTNTWETTPYGAGMPTGTERTLVMQHNDYRSQLALGNNDTVYWMSNRPSFNCLISFHIPTRTWHAYAVPQSPFPYVQMLDENEPALVYDPVSNVLLHLNSLNLTSQATALYIFNIDNGAWEVPRAVPTFTDPVFAGCSYWDPKTGSLAIWGRTIGGVPGIVNWHYRYAAV